jgi:YidC/Oxa1 family membrane protein insertase
MVLSAIVSAAATLALGVRIYWHRLRAWLRQAGGRPTPGGSAPDSQGATRPGAASDTAGPAIGRRRAWDDYRRFRRLSPDARNIVVYSESGQDWHHFQPIVEELSARPGRCLCYVSSDPTDPGLSRAGERVACFFIGRGLLRTLFFQLLRADVLVLTMMDLGCFQLRRSLYPVHYVYLFHSLSSTHMLNFAESFDHYDTILCAGPHQLREIRRREQLAGLPRKNLVAHGYARLEALCAQACARAPGSPGSGPPLLLIAPTWGENSTLNVCGEPLVAQLLEAGYRVILRPHYQTLQLTPQIVERIRRRFDGHPAFEYVDRMGESESLFRSDLLISDWSAMAVEYFLALEKPVLFIDVPRRVRNPRYEELELEPLEVSIRREVGDVLHPDQLAEAPARVEKLLAAASEWRGRAPALRERCVFNLGTSARAGAAEIARLADLRARERRGA